MKYVSFSLWGDKPIYCVGAIVNAILYQRTMKDWQVIVWHDDTVPSGTLEQLRQNKAMLRNCSKMKWCPPCMWRFLINDQRDCDRYIVRDCDSRLCDREVWAVRRWEESGRPFHLIRDHPNHGMWPILAGMWGCMRGFLDGMDGMIRSYRSPHTGYGHDQNFLRDVVWPKAKLIALQHDCGCIAKDATPMPKRTDKQFVGLRYDERDCPKPEDLKGITL